MPAPNGRNRIDISQIDPASLDGGTSAVKIATSDASAKIAGHYTKYDAFGRLTDGGIPSSGSGNSNYADDTGAANAYVVTLPAPLTLVKGAWITFTALHGNNTASTLTVDSGSPIAITKRGAFPLDPGDISDDQIVLVVYDGTHWQQIGANNASSIALSPILDSSSGNPIFDVGGNWIFAG